MYYRFLYVNVDLRASRSASMGQVCLPSILPPTPRLTELTLVESYCIPHFDSPSVFARILDKDKVQDLGSPYPRALNALRRVAISASPRPFHSQLSRRTIRALTYVINLTYFCQNH
jgi:hypothetical protein